MNNLKEMFEQMQRETRRNTATMLCQLEKRRKLAKEHLKALEKDILQIGNYALTMELAGIKTVQVSREAFDAAVQAPTVYGSLFCALQRQKLHSETAGVEDLKAALKTADHR